MPLRSALLLALLLAATGARAQIPGGPGGFGGTLTGVLVDAATGETLPSATVALYSGPDSTFATGAAADLDGAFRVESVRPGTYLVRASFLGYRTLRLRGIAVQAGQTTALDTLRLEVDAALLDGAEVVGRREFVEQRADRTVYNVEDQAVTTGGSVLETLQTLPSVEVDTDGAVSLRGNQNVVVQINGRPVPVRGAQLAALLRQIPANRVGRVEVIPNPSARYDPDGMSGILNIVLAEGTDRGLTGGLTFGGGTQPNAELGGNLSYQAGPWDIYSSYGYRYSDRGFLGTTSTDRLTLGLSTFQDQTSSNGENSHFGSLSTTYSLSPSTSIAFEGSGGLGFENSTNRIDYRNTFPRDSVTTSNRLTDGDGTDVNLDGALIFKHEFDRAAAAAKPGASGPQGGGFGGRGGPGGHGGGGGGAGATGAHELAVEVRASRNRDESDDLFTTQILTPESLPDLARSNGNQGATEGYAQIDYSRPLGAVRLETGAKATLRQITSDQDYELGQSSGFVNDPTRTNAFTYDEGVYAAYVQAGREFGNLAVQGGLRAEAATRDFTLRGDVPPLPTGLEIDLTDTKQSYQSLFPSVFGTYSFAPGSLVKASYSRRIERPRSRSLNPFPNYEDTLSVRVGNPQLRPEYTDAYELTLQYKYFLTVTPFFRHTTDVARQRFTTNPVTGVVTQFQQNLDSQDSYGADVTLLAALGPVRGFVSGTVARTVVDGGSVETGLGSDAISYSTRASLQLKVRQGTDVQFFGFYRAPQDTEDGRISGFGFGSLGLSQKVSDQLQLSARVSDPFKTARFEFSSNRNGVALEGIRRPQIQQFSATLTYSFGSGPTRRDRTPQPDQTGGQDGAFGL